ncbi:hypothetical protein KZZ52_18750 [Dactylosporangium sp. AC04546]|uniref:hypothetical protein n=1 Tax=Dactylosporangium sp. AC04546 TaxID=2862460 RepID=UPI001EDF0A56|nr:hypothetical protein [Dactylosporangium sp. AC04546]WVK87343.1 hypothetical protein KZZ52_18750 [Dactylosporangium sp. AC04546]
MSETEATMLVARSTTECHLYMVLHPCERCGEADFPWSRHDRGRDDTSVYEGECPSCRAPRRFAFALAPDPVPPPAYGGPEPSQIIDPGEFLAMGERAAQHAAVPPDASPYRRAGAREAAADAVAAVEEVLKFLPPSAETVPEAAFTSAAGRELYAADPARFHRDRLEAELQAHRQALLALSRG